MAQLAGMGADVSEAADAETALEKIQSTARQKFVLRPCDTGYADARHGRGQTWSDHQEYAFRGGY